jgi:hypothetical protein
LKIDDEIEPTSFQQKIETNTSNLRQILEKLNKMEPTSIEMEPKSIPKCAKMCPCTVLGRKPRPRSAQQALAANQAPYNQAIVAKVTL